MVLTKLVQGSGLVKFEVERQGDGCDHKGYQQGPVLGSLVIFQDKKENGPGKRQKNQQALDGVSQSIHDQKILHFLFPLLFNDLY
jgi:hypothetical protein